MNDRLIHHPDGLDPWRLTADLGFGTLSAGIVLLAALTMSPTMHVGVLVAFGVAMLERVPVLLLPVGRLSLIPLITLPTIVFFGWQPVILGTALGLALSAFPDRTRHFLSRALVELPALALAGAAVALTARAWAPVGTGIPTTVACVAYFGALMALESVYMCVEEHIDWPRAARYIAGMWSLHAGVVTVIVVVSVVAGARSPWALGPYVMPVLAALVGLELYHPRILRGQEQQRTLASVALMASAMDAKDPYTGDHVHKVARLSRRVARVLGLDEHQAHRVYLAGLLHDIGKVVVPPEILRKPTKLTDEERAVMQRHVEAGADMIRNIRGLEEISALVEATHEHLDGSGYPRRLGGAAIPLEARIILAVDAYNALTSNRPYRAARSPELAYQELQAHAGGQFDADVVGALAVALGFQTRRPRRVGLGGAGAIRLLRTRSFALLYAGELISYLGDEVFLIALALWIYQLTGSAAMLATTLIAAVAGQGVFGFLAGAMADRFDRRLVIIISDIGRAILIALLPLVLPRSVSLGLVLLLAANIGTIFFRSSLMALVPTIVAAEDLGTASALMQTTARIAEVAGGILGAGMVALFGYHLVFYVNAVSFLGSALAVALIPLAWRAGLATTPPRAVGAEIREGLRFIWQTPLHRFLALLIFPGYLTLAVIALLAPMVVGTAHLSPMAYGVVNSGMGVGKLVAAVVLAGGIARWMTPSFVVAGYLVTSLGIALFASSSLYPLLVLGAAVWGLGNVATTVANMTLSIAATPNPLVGRVMASRQVFIAVPHVLGMLLFGRLADLAGAPIALYGLAVASGAGVLLVWAFGRRGVPQLAALSPAQAELVAVRSAELSYPDSADRDVITAQRG